MIYQDTPRGVSPFLGFKGLFARRDYSNKGNGLEKSY
jgi:hypothetical protein